MTKTETLSSILICPICKGNAVEKHGSVSCQYIKAKCVSGKQIIPEGKKKPKDCEWEGFIRGKI